MHPVALLLVGMGVVVGSILLLRLHAFLALLLGALVVALLTTPGQIEQYALSRPLAPAAARALAETPAAERIARGFGQTCGQIGLLIALASVIGAGLLESGAADRVVRAALRVVGERRAGLAFAGSGFLLAVPVFFDTVFYLMIPLAKSLRMRTGRHFLLYVLSIVAGGTMAHSLVPPTPGPLFIASEFAVPLAWMIAGGSVVGLAATAAGYGFARWADRRWDLPLRDAPDTLAQLEALARRDVRHLPPLWLSLVPILLPLLLITAGAVAEPAGGAAAAALRLLGERNLALALGAAVALGLLAVYGPRGETAASVRGALAGAGLIILITGAGGAFGQVLQQTGIGGAIERLTAGSNLAVLPMAFLLTTLVRTAQGSATVAMITAAAAFKGLASPADLGFHPLYLALAIGCGSKPVMWMNDSGFWIISQMGGMTEREGLRTLTPQLALMGVTGLAATMLAAWLLPLA